MYVDLLFSIDLSYDKIYNKSKCGQQLWKIYQKNLVRKLEKYALKKGFRKAIFLGVSIYTVHT